MKKPPNRMRAGYMDAVANLYRRPGDEDMSEAELMQAYIEELAKLGPGVLRAMNQEDPSELDHAAKTMAETIGVEMACLLGRERRQ